MMKLGTRCLANFKPAWLVCMVLAGSVHAAQVDATNDGVSYDSSTRLFTVNFVATDLSRILATLAATAHTDIEFNPGSVTERISLQLSRATLEEVVRKSLKDLNYVVHFVSDQPKHKKLIKISILPRTLASVSDGLPEPVPDPALQEVPMPTAAAASLNTGDTATTDARPATFADDPAVQPLPPPKPEAAGNYQPFPSTNTPVAPCATTDPAMYCMH